MRKNLFPIALMVLLGMVNSRAQSASAMRAICLLQVGNVDRSIFPLAISDSEAGAKWCQQELGMPARLVPPELVSPGTMTQFLGELRTVTGGEERVPPASSAYKLIVLQPEGKRVMILDRRTTHDLVKRFERHCRGTRLHDDLSFIESELGPPRNKLANQ